MNTPIYVTRLFHIDYAHRVLGHEGRCKHLHGHRGVAEVTIKSDVGLDGRGRVLDFGRMKEIIGKWIDDNWDHNILLHPDDPLLTIDTLVQVDVFGGKEPYIMRFSDTGVNPTAENMAAVLHRESTTILRQSLHDRIEVVRVRMWETPNCFADYQE